MPQRSMLVKHIYMLDEYIFFLHIIIMSIYNTRMKNKFYRWKQQSGMTYREIADLLGVKDDATVSKWANGNDTPCKKNMLAVHNLTNGEVSFMDWDI